MTHEEYMQCAFDEAYAGMRNNEGGPFGSVIVLNDKIIGRGHNMVTSTNDPTAHAEMVAIRNACRELNAFHLPGAVLYASCEPCPMCLAAIYWANIKTVYYGADRTDAAQIGFSDKFIYDEFQVTSDKKEIKIQQLLLPFSKDLFDEWTHKQDKKSY